LTGEERKALTAAPDIEVAVLGGALQNVELAQKMGLDLETRDFTGTARPEVYRAICEVALEVDEISPGVVFEQLGPDMVADLDLEVDTLQGWALDSPVEDLPLFTVYVRKLRRYGVQRQVREQLRTLAGADVDEAAHSERVRESIVRTLETLALNMGSLMSLNGNAGKLNVVEIADALEGKISAPPWAVVRWLCRGDVAVLGGESGAGKSFVLLELALSLALGRDWLQGPQFAQDLEPQRVLYVDEEQSATLVQRRLQRWAYGRRRDVAPDRLGAAPIRYLCQNSINFDDELKLRELAAVVDDFAPDWIFFDTLSKVHARDENSNSQMTQLFTGKIKPLAARCGAGMIFAHHYSKPSKDRGDSSSARLRGASSIKADLDQLWALEADPTSGSLILRHEKNRWGPEAYPLQVEIDDVDGEDGIEIWSPGRGDDARGAVINLLQGVGTDPVGVPEIMTAIIAEGLRAPKAAWRRIRRDLIEEGVLFEKKAGRKKLYCLAINVADDEEELY